MILSHARLPVPTLPRERELASEDSSKKVNHFSEKLTKKLTNELLNEFLKSRRQGLSNNTRLFYHRCLSKAIGIDFTPEGINSFLASLQCGNGKFAYYRALRAFSHWMYRHNYVSDNPIKLVDCPFVAKRIMPAVTEDQLQILLKNCETFRDQCIISLLFDSGLRISELCAIKVSDIDWNTNIIKVIIKGNKEAKAAFTPKTAILLQEYIKSNPDSVKLFNMRRRGIQDMLKRLASIVGFPCNAHSFRRGFACNLHKKGLSTLSIMHLGRWSSLDMVSRYCKSITFDDCLKFYKEVTNS